MQPSSHRYDHSDSSSFEQSLSSAISAITLDEDGFNEMSARFDPTLKPMLEHRSHHERRATGKHMDLVRMNSSRRFSTTVGPSTETKLCAMPMRKSSSTGLDFKTASEDCIILNADEDTSFCYDDPLLLEESSNSFSSFYNSEVERSLSSKTPTYPYTSTNSLDLDDIFEVASDDDVSLTPSAKEVEDYVKSLQRPDSPESGDERFRVACPKEKTNSITMPSRRGSQRM